MTDNDDNCSVRMSCGFFILFLILITELGFSIYSGTYLNLASECVGGAGTLTLSTWIFVGSLVSFIMNALFLTWYCLRAVFFANNGSRGSADILDCFVCCVCGTPMAVLIVLSLIFLLVWFVVGVLIAVNVPDHCKKEYQELFSVGTSCFFIMAASFFAKIIVVSKKCPCDR